MILGQLPSVAAEIVARCADVVVSTPPAAHLGSLRLQRRRTPRHASRLDTL
jgi:hypothetical protein